MIYEKTKRYIIPFDDVPSPRAEMPEISVEERKLNYVEVETGFPEEVAIQEAKRCLSCRRCLGCALCWAECEPEAIDFSIPHEEVHLEFDEVCITGGQDNLFHPFNSDLGFGEYPNVITDLQFERMLSPTGPTDGMIFSPLNGEMPAKVAIVQGNADNDEDHLLSSLVLAVNESIIALDKTDGLEVVVVSPIIQPFKDQFLSDAENVSGLKIIDGLPTEANKDEDSETITLSYSQNGEAEKNDFDMIVVLTKPKEAPEMKSLSRKLDQEILQ